jgi:hypothetical protein
MNKVMMNQKIHQQMLMLVLKNVRLGSFSNVYIIGLMKIVSKF